MGSYPGTGKIEEIGHGAGEGATLNLPFPVGSGDNVMRTVFDEMPKDFSLISSLFQLGKICLPLPFYFWLHLSYTTWILCLWMKCNCLSLFFFQQVLATLVPTCLGAFSHFWAFNILQKLILRLNKLYFSLSFVS